MVDQFSGVVVHRQRFTLALRREMGWPSFRPANDCLDFSIGGPVDTVTGLKLARIVERECKDLIHTSWRRPAAPWPCDFAVVIRMLLTLDVVTGLAPWCAGDDDPVILVGVDEFFAHDRRGSLVRLAGRPAMIVPGRRLALRRIEAAARARSVRHLAGKRLVRTGGDWIEPEVPAEIPVRFT